MTDVQDSEFRTYHTGDLGRTGVDGCLEYMGRQDSRTKVRGQVVDVAEVESALLKLDTVQEAVVKTIEDELSGKRLVAFLVPSISQLPVVSQMRQQLVELFPDHMIPAKFVSLERMPLTESGKIDRRALSALPSTRPDLEVPFVSPETETQTKIQKIWEDLLGISPIGIKDDFLELGGDSLLAIRMITQVERAIGLDIPISVLASETSIESLAEVILNQEIKHLSSIIDVEHDDTNPPFYYLHGNYMDGGWNCRQFAPFLRGDKALIALTPSGLDGRPVLESYEAMASHHLEKLQSIHKGGPYLLGGHCNGGLIAMEMARQLEQKGEKVGLLVLIAASASNLRFKWMYGLFKRIDSLTGPSAGIWLRFYLLIRRFLILLQKRSGIQWILHLPRIFLKIPKYVVAHWNNTIDDQSNHTESNEEVETVVNQDKRQPVRNAYQRIDNLYMPEPYQGRITILWPEQEGETPEEGANNWRKISNDIQFRVIPGDHATCRTIHAATYGGELQACFDDLYES